MKINLDTERLAGGPTIQLFARVGSPLREHAIVLPASKSRIDCMLSRAEMARYVADGVPRRRAHRQTGRGASPRATSETLRRALADWSTRSKLRQVAVGAAVPRFGYRNRKDLEVQTIATNWCAPPSVLRAPQVNVTSSSHGALPRSKRRSLPMGDRGSHRDCSLCAPIACGSAPVVESTRS